VGLLDDERIGRERRHRRAGRAWDAQLAANIVDRIQHIAALGDDLTMSTAIEALAPRHTQDSRVLATIAGQWDFSVRNQGMLMASNAVFDGLVEHAPSERVTTEVLERALASEDPYLKARGIGGLAALGRDMSEHIPTLAPLLASPTASTQAHAERAFVRIGEAARPVLQQLAQKGKTKAAAQRALAKLDKR
jgi:hypothetical protein